MNEARKIRAREIGAPLRRPRGNMEAGHRKLKLMVYDLGVLAFVAVMILRVFPRGNVTLSWGEAGLQFLLAAVCVMVSRNVFKVYSQVWRYSRTNSYLRLLTADVVGGPDLCGGGPSDSRGASHLLPHGGDGGHCLYGVYGAPVPVHLAV